MSPLRRRGADAAVYSAERMARASSCEKKELGSLKALLLARQADARLGTHTKELLSVASKSCESGCRPKVRSKASYRLNQIKSKGKGIDIAWLREKTSDMCVPPAVKTFRASNRARRALKADRAHRALAHSLPFETERPSRQASESS